MISSSFATNLQTTIEQFILSARLFPLLLPFPSLSLALSLIFYLELKCTESASVRLHREKRCINIYIQYPKLIITCVRISIQFNLISFKVFSEIGFILANLAIDAAVIKA